MQQKLISFLVIGLLSAFVLTSSSICIKLPAKNTKIKTDAFGNTYVINNNQIYKYNDVGVLQKKFSTKRYGKIDCIDVTNPLKICVYYKDFQQLLFLDNQLTQSNQAISLETLGYEQTLLTCSSMNNSFWLYDNQNNELVRFNQDLKTLVKTGNLKQLLGYNITPAYMMEHNGLLYLNCPKVGILQFDIYGTYSKTLPLLNITEFNIVNGQVFYFENHSLKEYQPQTFNTITKQFNDTLLKTVYWNNNKFFKVYADSVIIN